MPFRLFSEYSFLGQVPHRNISSKFAYFSGMDVLRHWDRRIENAVLRIIKKPAGNLSGGQKNRDGMSSSPFHRKR
jgi:hypothetical protein